MPPFSAISFVSSYRDDKATYEDKLPYASKQYYTTAISPTCFSSSAAQVQEFLTDNCSHDSSSEFTDFGMSLSYFVFVES